MSSKNIDLIGPGSINQWKKASAILGDNLYSDAIDESRRDVNGMPNYYDSPEDVSRALAETPNDRDPNIFTTDLTLAHLGPVELPCTRMHILCYYVTETVEETLGWNLSVNKKLVRLGGIRGSVVPSRAKRGITSILMKSTQNVKINQIQDVVGKTDAGFDGEQKVGMFQKIKDSLGIGASEDGKQ